MWVEVCAIGAECLKRNHTAGADILAVQQRLEGFQYGSICGLGQQAQQWALALEQAAQDDVGRIATIAQKEHEQIYSQPGWVEHNPEEIWQRTLEVIGEALQRAGISAKELAAVGITNQRETTVTRGESSGQGRKDKSSHGLHEFN